MRFQHKYYLPLTLGLGLVLPTLIGWSYGDALGGFVWGGVAARLMVGFPFRAEVNHSDPRF